MNLTKIGNSELLNGKLVSVVGTRTPTEKAVETAEKLALRLKEEGYVTVSGLALGIDAVVHSASLPATVAVLPTPPERTYPMQNSELRGRIEMEGGLVVSQFASGTETKRWHFLQRDKLMAELSLATVVVEEKDRGGAIWQAEYACSAGRAVFFFEPPESHPEFAHRPDVYYVKTPEEVISVLKKLPVQGELF